MKTFRSVLNGKSKMSEQLSHIRYVESLTAPEAAAAMLLVLRELPPAVLVAARDVVKAFEEEAEVRRRSADEALGL